jgi:hypothetical protein
MGVGVIWCDVGRVGVWGVGECAMRLRSSGFPATKMRSLCF